MKTLWIPLQSIPQAGTTITVDNQDFWENSFQEFSLVCRIVEPLSATMLVLPQEDGILFRGTLKGKLAMPCNRCSEDSIVTIDHSFDSFEVLPADPYGPASEDEDLLDLEVDEAVIRTIQHGRGVEINPSALAWEELCLALPVKPLCMQNCKGLCPLCGCNFNTDTCTCTPDTGDPRLAVLRELSRKNKKD